MKLRSVQLGKPILLALALGVAPVAMLIPAAASAQIAFGISVQIGPPPLPVYFQPPMPAPNYIWAPGYWSWDDWWGDYYWVPGTWVMAPRPGYLWTPGWWGWGDGAYVWHGGYWGQHVGWYGGINYGYGYTGSGFFGGEWRGNNFYYNRSVTNIGSTRITNVYNRTVVINNNTTINNNHASYAGGPGGVQAQPTAEQRLAMHEQHIAPTPQQTAHVQAAQTNRAAFASVNRGRPTVLAVAQPRPAPVGPVHPVGMARPAPGGGVPAPAGAVHPAYDARPAQAMTPPAARTSAQSVAPYAAGRAGEAPRGTERGSVDRAGNAFEPARPPEPSAPAYHPEATQAYRPQPAPAYRPPAPPRPDGGGEAHAYHAAPAAPAYHPAPAPAYHPPAPRPAAPPPPAPRPPAPRPPAPQHEGGGDDHEKHHER